eukprot:2980924-Prymnesium_polylepis.2
MAKAVLAAECEYHWLRVAKCLSVHHKIRLLGIHHSAKGLAHSGEDVVRVRWRAVEDLAERVFVQRRKRHALRGGLRS